MPLAMSTLFSKESVSDFPCCSSVVVVVVFFFVLFVFHVLCLGKYFFFNCYYSRLIESELVGRFLCGPNTTSRKQYGTWGACTLMSSSKANQTSSQSPFSTSTLNCSVIVQIRGRSLCSTGDPSCLTRDETLSREHVHAK